MRWLAARCSATWPSLHPLCLCVAALSPSLSTKVPPAAGAPPPRAPAPRHPRRLLRAGSPPAPPPLFRMDTQRRYVDENTQTWSRSHNRMGQKCGSWCSAAILNNPRYQTAPSSAQRGRITAAVMGKNTLLHNRGKHKQLLRANRKCFKPLKAIDCPPQDGSSTGDKSEQSSKPALARHSSRTISFRVNMSGSHTLARVCTSLEGDKCTVCLVHR